MVENFWRYQKFHERQKNLEAEPREPREMAPKRYRGNPQSPAEELFPATLNLCTGAVEQCRREVEDEGDLNPPQETPSPQAVVETFVALLVYSLLESMQGADGHQIIEISLSGLLLASSLTTTTDVH